MSLAAADIAFAKDLFADLPDVTAKRMFGGMAFYSAGTIFALMRSDAQILIKAQDAAFEAKLSALGSEKWIFTRKNGAASSMPYWSLPTAALDDPELACELAREALSHLR